MSPHLHTSAEAQEISASDPERNVALQRQVMTLSLGVAVVMLIGKLAAWSLTGSSAIFSDAAESVVHFAATAMAGFSLWYASQPPDDQHPYGHGKIAYFSSGIEGGLILIAAVIILIQATLDLIEGPEVEHLGIGLAITGALGLINLFLGLALVRVGRSTNALVLVANGYHVLTDMWTSLGVVVGVALVWATGAVWLDPVVAILMGLNILWTSGRLIREAFAGLMETIDIDETARVMEVLDRAAATDRIKGHHHVRHRRVNDQIWLEQHLLMEDDLSLVEAHDRASQIEAEQRALFPQSHVQITSHLEPVTHDHADDVPHDAIVDGSTLD
ncbi:Ferrous-iron efflux pump FieF [Planctomycetes bacterium Poly30]|uniref:Ferrous-iron efflux pump FieF n=1 Tax=Saltatorellus ferox TaxID=2528018 RepID=A0A518EPT6_9BACT|nr:Ferrous-iron efflux pump FieF [Planctomycetes bacterium Poly30]